MKYTAVTYPRRVVDGDLRKRWCNFRSVGYKTSAELTTKRILMILFEYFTVVTC